MIFKNVILRTNADNPLTITETGVGDMSAKDYYMDFVNEAGAVVLELTSTGVSPAITVSYVSPTNIIAILVSRTNIDDTAKFVLNGKYKASLKRVNTTELIISDFEFIVNEGYTDNP